MDASGPGTPDRPWWRRRRRVIGLCIAVPLALVAWSFGSYVLVNNGDTLAERSAEWARNHHLGGLVDFAEKQRYSKPPSKTASGRLAVDPAAGQATPVTAASRPVTGEAPAAVGAPPAIAPAVSPALPNEGAWQLLVSAGGAPAVWATSIRPIAAYPSVVASVAEMDQTRLRFGLFNGNQLPGGAGWKRGDHVPPALQPALVAAFNGGFRFDNEPGGYLTEGRAVRPLINGQATLAVDRTGHLFVGEYGRDLTNDGRWISLRQNLPLIVDGGVSQALLKPGTNWGRDYHNVIYVTRSAVCLRSDGRYAFVAIGPVDAPMLGDALVTLGCQRAIELDINGTWPTFFSFHTGPDGHAVPEFLDRRMSGSRTRYLTGSSKEFFAGFDAALVPAGSILDPP